MIKPVVTFGEIMLRLMPPDYERFLQTPRFMATFGGAEANVAVAVAGYGLPSRHVTVLPSNPITDAFIGELRRFGVDTTYIVRGEGRFGVYYVEPGANQRPSNVVYDRDYSAIALAKPGDIDWEKVFEGAGWFHVTGITPAVSQGAADLALESVRKATEMGLTVSCDLNYRQKLWNYGKAATEVMPELFKHVDVGFISEEDCQKALGIHVDSAGESSELRVAQYRSLTERVLDLYPRLKVAAITMRESISALHNGWSACLHNRKEFLVSRHYDITHIVDRLGNGDAFAAGLIYGLLTLASPQDALEFAVAGGCLKHSIRGDFNRFSAEDVNGLLQSGGSGRVQR
jgi:2-dehydro-3-deoxygluconokinase